MDHHSDLNYLVDASLFGSTVTSTSLSNSRQFRSQIIFKGQGQNLEGGVKNLLLNIGIQIHKDTLSILNTTEGCLVKFQCSNEAEKVMQILVVEKEKLNNSIIFEWYEPKDDRNVYVKNLPIDFNEDQLKELFKSYGPIISVKVMRKEKNNNSIGFVRFQNKVDAEKAIIEMNLKRLDLISLDRCVQCELSKVNSSCSGSMANADEHSSQLVHGTSNLHPFNTQGLYDIIPRPYNPNLVYMPQPMPYQGLPIQPIYTIVPQNQPIVSQNQPQIFQQMYGDVPWYYIQYHENDPNLQ